jgi:hypothetical protein
VIDTRPETTIYRGQRIPGGLVAVFVCDDAAGWAAPLVHFVRHSHGLGWGDSGPGAADLALSLLVDALGPAALCPMCDGRRRVVWLGPDAPVDPVPYNPIRHAGADPELVTDCLCSDGLRSLAYREFTCAVVSGWPDTWTISRAQILDFLTTLYPPEGELPEWLQDVVTGARS